MLKQFEVQNIYIGEYKPIYKWEYIEYRMNANEDGDLFVPTWWYSISWVWNCPYSWKISIDGWTEATYSWTWSTNPIYFDWYTAWTSHTIKIVPTTEDYQRARAFWWSSNGNSYLTEIVYDSSYMWYAVSAIDTWNRFRYRQYSWCTSLINSAEEYFPDTVTTVWENFMGRQYYWCTSLTEIRWWYDLSLWNSSYREDQYYWCKANKTVKVLSDVWYSSYNLYTLENTYVTSVSVPNQYLTNFKNTSNQPRANIDDSKFIWY